MGRRDRHEPRRPRRATRRSTRLRSTVLPACTGGAEGLPATETDRPADGRSVARISSRSGRARATLLEHAEPSIYELDLDALKAVLEPADDGPRRAWATHLRPVSYRAAHSAVKTLFVTIAASAERLELVEQARPSTARWDRFARARPGSPSAPSNLAEVVAALDELDAELSTFASTSATSGFGTSTDEDLLLAPRRAPPRSADADEAPAHTRARAGAGGLGFADRSSTSCGTAR